jgi:3-oxocholest-4-en-26-oate---CoA ligase
VAGYNLADLYESVADAVPEREAVVVGDRRLTYAGLDERANRLANHLAASGIGPGDHVGLQLRNGTEYLEGMLAAFKLRAVPINVNHRYTAAELAPLYDDAGLTALVHHRGMSPEIDQALASLDTPLTVRLWVDDDTDVDAPAGRMGTSGCWPPPTQRGRTAVPGPAMTSTSSTPAGPRGTPRA